MLTIGYSCAANEETNDAPLIPFKSRKGNEIDMKLKSIIKQYNFKCPIVYIKKDNYMTQNTNVYLVGTDHKIIQLKNDNLLIKDSVGFERFIDFMQRNERYYLE